MIGLDNGRVSSGAPTIPPVDPETERKWLEYLENPDTMQRVGRRVFSRIPANPRCRWPAWIPGSSAGAWS
jgi:hypothetical protein